METRDHLTPTVLPEVLEQSTAQKIVSRKHQTTQEQKMYRFKLQYLIPMLRNM